MNSSRAKDAEVYDAEYRYGFDCVRPPRRCTRVEVGIFRVCNSPQALGTSIHQLHSLADREKMEKTKKKETYTFSQSSLPNMKS